jgi:hypothetical protein
MMRPSAGSVQSGHSLASGERWNVGADNYEIRIKGRVSDSLLPAFEGLTVTTEPVETILYGPIADQEALHRLMTKLQALGLEVVEFRRLPGQSRDPGATPPPSP